MKQNNKSFWDYIAMSCYKYAPESFKAFAVLSFSHGNKNIPEYTKINLTSEETSRCGYAFACGGRKQALAELKKIIRQKIKASKNYATIGFFSIDNPKQYHFTQHYTTDKHNINGMLRVYKAFKEYIVKNDCKLEAYTLATLDGHYKPETIEKKYDYIDINRPVIINLKANKNYILA